MSVLQQQTDRNVCPTMSQTLDEAVEGFEPSPELVSVMAGSRLPAILGLDIGTSGVRAALFDEKGREISDASVRVKSRTLTLGAGAFVDPDILLEQVAQTLDALFAKLYDPIHRIELISVSCFWHSLLGIDDAERPTTAVLGWSDTRAAAATQLLRTTLDEAKFHARTGCRFHPSYWPAKLLRLRDEEPETWTRTTRWLSFSEYLALKFFGETAISVSMASGSGLLDQRTCEWDMELLRALDVPGEKLPEVATATRTFQNLNYEYAVRWPQLSEARLAPAIGDGAANNLGEGCMSAEAVALMIGTSGAMRVLIEDAPPDQLSPALWCYRADRRRIVIGGALSDGGSLYNWIKDSMLFGEDTQSINDELQTLSPDGHGLTVLPFWLGERSPGWNTNARGGIFGTTLATRPIEILRAAMEAVAYRFALVANALERFAPGARLVASGQALRSSPTWAQIVADVLGRPLVLSEITEASTRGAALLALEARGRIDSISDFPVVAASSFEPDMSCHERYREGLKRQQQLYDRLIAKN
ncbi:MAG TPA: gluconokinase [Pyrinomonadaceae bacterium]|nr:gluconokinase [Pyrinomonadaceae bacterium]